MRIIKNMIFIFIVVLTGCNSGGQYFSQEDLSKSNYLASTKDGEDKKVRALNRLNNQIRTIFNINHSPILMKNQYSESYYECSYQLEKIRNTLYTDDMIIQLYERHVANCGEYSIIAYLSVLHDLLIQGVNEINYYFENVYVAHVKPGDHAFAIVQGHMGQYYIFDPMFNMVQLIGYTYNGQPDLQATSYWPVDNNFFYANSSIVIDYNLTSRLREAIIFKPQLLKLMEREAISLYREAKGWPKLNDQTIDKDYRLDYERFPLSLRLYGSTAK